LTIDVVEFSTHHYTPGAIRTVMTRVEHKERSGSFTSDLTLDDPVPVCLRLPHLLASARRQ
jgi:hypothetical protein